MLLPEYFSFFQIIPRIHSEKREESFSLPLPNIIPSFRRELSFEMGSFNTHLFRISWRSVSAISDGAKWITFQWWLIFAIITSFRVKLPRQIKSSQIETRIRLIGRDYQVSRAFGFVAHSAWGVTWLKCLLISSLKRTLIIFPTLKFLYKNNHYWQDLILL